MISIIDKAISTWSSGLISVISMVTKLSITLVFTVVIIYFI